MSRVRRTSGNISSAEIVAVTTELRHRQAARRNGKDGKDDDARRELDMDEHKKSIPELCADLTTSATLVRCPDMIAWCLY
jgi:hypothetical protein